MMTRNWLAVLAVSLTALAGCAEPAAVAGAPEAGQGVGVVVHKTPTCGCCGDWVEHLRESGFDVTVRDLDDLSPVKERVGVPYGLGSCHTAEVEGYFVEGHVPAQDVERLLAERPDARGLTVPGMPLGSPGMEVPSGEVQPYDVLLVKHDGSTAVFASHR